MAPSEATGNVVRVPWGNEGFAYRHHTTAAGQSPVQHISRASIIHKEYRCHCGKLYLARQNQRKTSCGCKKRSPAATGPLDRFVSRIAFSDKCWIWTGQTHWQGYGLFVVGGQRVRAHRFSYELHHGPTTLFVCHTCDTPACVRPEHLFAGTHQSNMTDMVRKGRRRTGPGSGNRKLSEADIPVILYCSRRGSTNRDIAAQYGVTQATIWHIVKGRTWQHVPRA